jgi:transcriptional regulator with XRE-family HTH domain
VFRKRLEREFATRREKNSRYSLRAFATFLGADHSTVSQILRGTRPVPAARIRAWGKRLGLSAEEISAYIAAGHVPDAQVLDRQKQLVHWTAEAMSIVTEPVHYEIIRLSRSKAFRADCRWIAKETGFTADEVNIAVSRLLRLGLIEMHRDRWRDLTGLAELNPEKFRKLALAKVREKNG